MDEANLLCEVKDEMQILVKLQNKKILVVEDDKNITVLLGKAILEIANDSEIVWAASLENAIEQLIKNTDITKKNPYDLIIADIILEGPGTGLDLYKLMYGLYPKIPFLVISSLVYRKVSQVLEHQRKNNFYYLQKPFLYSACKVKIEKILTDLNSDTQKEVVS
jgi:DNA-binding NtrC family response regulator